MIKIMGILNITPDSFSDGGKFFNVDSAIEQGKRLIAEGADILDIGGESTRPGAEAVSLEEELRRTTPVIGKLAHLGIPISIDTYKSEVAETAVKAGASIINDISGLRFDNKMAEIAAKYQTGLILMHIKGTPRDMQVNPVYEDLMNEISQYLLGSAEIALKSGVAKDKIMLDPGIGFGKTLKHNLEILNRLPELKRLGYPLVIGVSRKSFIGKLLDLPVEERLYGTIGACVTAVLKGADILRVHDVKPVKEAVAIANYIINIGEK
jgi:dihydropteroate synthase